MLVWLDPGSDVSLHSPRDAISPEQNRTENSGILFSSHASRPDRMTWSTVMSGWTRHLYHVISHPLIMAHVPHFGPIRSTNNSSAIFSFHARLMTKTTIVRRLGWMNRMYVYTDQRWVMLKLPCDGFHQMEVKCCLHLTNLDSRSHSSVCIVSVGYLKPMYAFVWFLFHVSYWFESGGGSWLIKVICEEHICENNWADMHTFGGMHATHPHASAHQEEL